MILEVGSGSLGIAPYLGRTITGLDTDFSGPDHPLIKHLTGSITNIPIADQSFDAVIAVDVLEHIPVTSRKKAILEIARVAKKYIIIAVPTGGQSQTQDDWLKKRFSLVKNASFKFLEEHQEYGLPKSEDMAETIRECVNILRRKGKLVIQGNENLSLRKFLMWGWATNNMFVDIFFRKVLLLFLPLLNILTKPPFYRTIYYFKFDNEDRN